MLDAGNLFLPHDGADIVNDISNTSFEMKAQYVDGFFSYFGKNSMKNVLNKNCKFRLVKLKINVHFQSKITKKYI